ncbi:DUF4058 family protein [Candidatus Viridilinea mediisalina]|uniref:DUF4058 domain-containing protein n=1 Tax=Candidatus Viridilinea mediisalina TaxID=2024553 RepID=A0A2A6RP22_9CHLR|nr:DUF4058 family protein [Candidatus Viridilinea mediisalina]PDW04797.1 hypothetical protein CJ255_01775 [Candidatus Viridilinea mediisalina]
MYSPFPGMDPYLEDPKGWPGVHLRMLGVISDMLVEQVAPHFSVVVEERVYIADEDDDDDALQAQARRQFVPDIFLVERPQLQNATTAVSLSVTPATIIERLPSDVEQRDRYLAIYDRRQRELVTTLELLSPWNKARGTRGQREFLAKRAAIFTTRTNWLEIDLLRAGERPEEVVGQSDYYALLHRGSNIGRLEVWYVDVRDPLPRISVPLRSPHPDAVLDLQAAFTTVYRRARYGDDVDYERPVPPPALPPAAALWAAQRVQEYRDTLDRRG